MTHTLDPANARAHHNCSIRRASGFVQTPQGPGIPALRPDQNSWTLAGFPALIPPDGVSQFRVVKQLVTSE